MARLSVRIDDAQKERLERTARATGKSESDIVREALEMHLGSEAPETCLDLARRAGIVAVTDGLPADLSTNRDHFDGFGRG